MNYAVISNTGKKVAASEPNINRNLKYVCPICKAPVHLRRGTGKIPHFAHNSSQAKTSCELYFASDNEYNHNKALKDREAPSRFLGLYLRIVEENKNKLNWALEIGIPEADEDYGRLKIPFGWDGLRIIPVTSIKKGGQRIRISPGIGPFSILQEGVPEGKWRNRINTPIPGLDLNNINVFRYSLYGGRRLNNDKELYWGRNYVFIWSSKFEPKWWPETEIIISKLKEYQAWNGVFIQIPPGYDKQVEEWVKVHTNRTVIHAPAEVNLISPLPEDRLPDGSYIIQNGKRVLLSITGELGAKKWQDINCYNSATKNVSKVKGQGNIPATFVLQLNEGRYDIWLDDEIEDCLQLIVGEKSNEALPIPRIQILGRDKLNSNKYEAQLFNYEAEELIVKSYKGEVAITDVVIPPQIEVKFKWRDSISREHTLNSKEINEYEISQSFEEQMIQVLNSIKSQKIFYVSIDAGNFGNVEIKMNSNHESEKITLLDMGINWRERAKYLLNIKKAYGDKRIIVNNKKLNNTLFCKEDQELFDLIHKEKHWPVQLIPHLQTLFKEYESVCLKSFKL